MDLLTSMRRHIEISAEEAAAFARRMRPLGLRRGQALMSQGGAAGLLAFVERGCLRVFHTDADLKLRTFQFATEGTWNGDLGGFLTGEPSRYTIEALEPSQVVALERAALESAFEEIPKLERLFRILYQNAYVAAQRRTGHTLDSGSPTTFAS